MSPPRNRPGKGRPVRCRQPEDRPTIKRVPRNTLRRHEGIIASPPPSMSRAPFRLICRRSAARSLVGTVPDHRPLPNLLAGGATGRLGHDLASQWLRNSVRRGREGAGPARSTSGLRCGSPRMTNRTPVRVSAAVFGGRRRRAGRTGPRHAGQRATPPAPPAHSPMTTTGMRVS